MKLFLDECVDRRLARHSAGHEVRMARQIGWTSIRNGELLAQVAVEFEAFITVDRNLAFQQNPEMLPVPVIILRPRTNRVADLIPLVDKFLDTLKVALPWAAICIE